MAITYAYSLDNGNAPVALDFGITSAVPLIGEMFIVSGGIATTKALAGTANSVKVGVSVGQNFRGLATGGTYAATTVGINRPSALTKLIVDPGAVYRIPWSALGTSAVVGSTYNLANATVNDDQTLNPGAVTAGNLNFTLVENDTTVYPDAPYGYAYVTISSANRVVPA